MRAEDRRFALRMFPYGVHVVTALDTANTPIASTVHWVTQTSFTPPLLMVALPVDGLAYAAIRATGVFALHMLGREDAEEALAFQSRPAIHEGDTLSGWPFEPSPLTGLPLLGNAVAVLELAVRAVLEVGDHHPLIAEPIEAHVRLPEQERPDEMMLHLRELGRGAFYGG